MKKLVLTTILLLNASLMHAQEKPLLEAARALDVEKVATVLEQGYIPNEQEVVEIEAVLYSKKIPRLSSILLINAMITPFALLAPATVKDIINGPDLSKRFMAIIRSLVVLGIPAMILKLDYRYLKKLIYRQEAEEEENITYLEGGERLRDN